MSEDTARISENLNQNIYYCPDIRVAENFILREREGLRDTESIAGDPLFSDLPGGDFSFNKASPAKTLEIEAISLDVLQEIGYSQDPWLPRAMGTSGFPFQSH